jgi:hypothetical protein
MFVMMEIMFILIFFFFKGRKLLVSLICRFATYFVY